VLLKIVFSAAFGLLFVSFCFSQRKQEENYSEIFSKDYHRAIQFLKSERRIDSIVRSHGLNPKEVTAIIFPELIRYNAIQDKIETFALETLYVQYGNAYANFSIGEFQIKPSFAECTEIDFLKKFGAKELLTRFQIKAQDTIENQENRLKRLKRLKDKGGMVNYLCLFWKLMDANYPIWDSEEEKIKFLASAYNCGYWKLKKEIEAYRSKKFFHMGFSATSTKYSYADISWYYFKQHRLFRE
jgi:hypothetical protein